MTVFLKILIWANSLSYDYPGLIGLSNLSFRRRLAPSLSSVSHRSEGLRFTRFSLSGQILFWHSLSFRFTFLGNDLPTHNKGGSPYLHRAGVLSRCLPWWLLRRRISVPCRFGIFSTRPVIPSTWFGFWSWQVFTAFDLYDLSRDFRWHSRLDSRVSYYTSYGFTSRIKNLASCSVFHKGTASVSSWEALLRHCVC